MACATHTEHTHTHTRTIAQFHCLLFANGQFPKDNYLCTWMHLLSQNRGVWNYALRLEYIIIIDVFCIPVSRSSAEPVWPDRTHNCQWANPYRNLISNAQARMALMCTRCTHKYRRIASANVGGGRTGKTVHLLAISCAYICGEECANAAATTMPSTNFTILYI